MGLKIKSSDDTSSGAKKKSGSKESNAVIAELQKEFGAKSIIRAGQLPNVERVQTGIFQLDLAMGGGFPRNRSVIIYGPESSMKTTIALKVCRAFQRMGQTAAWVDAEHALDADWASKLKVNTDDLVVAVPDTAEQAVDMTQALFHARDVGVVVLDSVGALATANEVESEAGKQIVGGSAALITKLMHKINSAMTSERKRDHFPTLVLINQNRFQIGKMFGDPEKMPGGQLLKFSSSMTIRLYGTDKIVKEVHPDIPAFKEVSGTIKKYRVPIVSKSFSFDLCVFPHKTLDYGDTNAWNTVANRLKAQGDLGKNGKVWQVAGDEFKTLDEMQQRYMDDFDFGDKLRKLVFAKASLLTKPPEIDIETGEVLTTVENE